MGHVADSTMSLDHIKDRLSSIRGHIVEAPLNFLIDEKNLVENLGW
jgi:phospholipase D1/2